jgi:dipeptidase
MRLTRTSHSTYSTFVLALVLLLTTNRFQNGSACSDVLVTPTASEDGSAMIAYNADDVSLYGVLYHYPSTLGKADENVTVYEWDTGVSSLMLSISLLLLSC